MARLLLVQKKVDWRLTQPRIQDPIHGAQREAVRAGDGYTGHGRA